MAATNGVGRTITNGVEGEHGWEINVLITDLNVQQKIRVSGATHIGGVMLSLVQDMQCQKDWSDHALWWPARNKWLVHTRSTLDQMGVSTENGPLHFTPMHKVVRVQLPDQQFVDVKLDFSVPVFRTCSQLATQLGMRHPEELSLKRHLDITEFRRCSAIVPTAAHSSLLSPQHRSARRPSDTLAHRPPPSQLSPGTGTGTQGKGLLVIPRHSSSMQDLSARGGVPTINAGTRTLLLQPAMPTTLCKFTSSGAIATWSVDQPDATTLLDFEPVFINSPPCNMNDVLSRTLVPQSLTQKANLNKAWLDSSISLLEQGISEFDTILIRFKYLQFFDLNIKLDPVRINQIYEQAKLSIVTGEVDCTDEEALMFSALQHQVELEQQQQQPAALATYRGHVTSEDDVEDALDDLELILEGSTLDTTKKPVTPQNHVLPGAQPASNPLIPSDIMSVPELTDYLRFSRPKKYALRSWRRHYFTFRDLTVSFFASHNDVGKRQPLGRFAVKGCEVTPDVNVAQSKFIIRLLVPSATGMTEMLLRCENAEQYIRWMPACKLAAKGRSMADASYRTEVEATRRLIALQNTSKSHARVGINEVAGRNGDDKTPSPTPNREAIEPDRMLSARHARRIGKTHSALITRILDAHANVRSLALDDAKLQYIRAWQSLPECGLHYFVVKFQGSKLAQELLAVTHNRLIRMTMDTGDVLKCWRFNDIITWHVNWQVKSILVKTNEEKLIFTPLSADCKIVHEFIGGYIFCSMRAKDANQELNEDLFRQLTSGRQQQQQSVTTPT